MADNNRKPVPAGGAPTEAVIDQAEKAPVQTDAGVEQQQQAEKAEGDVEARVLVAFEDHAVNDVIFGSPALIESLKLAGRVDPHADAVAYAKSLA